MAESCSGGAAGVDLFRSGRFGGASGGGGEGAGCAGGADGGAGGGAEGGNGEGGGGNGGASTSGGAAEPTASAQHTPPPAARRAGLSMRPLLGVGLISAACVVSRPRETALLAALDAHYEASAGLVTEGLREADTK